MHHTEEASDCLSYPAGIRFGFRPDNRNVLIRFSGGFPVIFGERNLFLLLLSYHLARDPPS
jgi:hypothetical protein